MLMKLASQKSGLTPLEKNSLTGLTMVELLVATFIGMLAFLVLFYVSLTIQNNISIGSGILDITQTGRFAANWMMRDIREANEVKSSYSTYSSDNTTLIINIPVTDINGTIIGYDTVIYTLDTPALTKLRRIVYAVPGSSRVNASEIIAQDIKSLAFSSNGTMLSSVTNKSTIKVLTMDVTTAKIIMGVERLNEVIVSSSLRNKK